MRGWAHSRRSGRRGVAPVIGVVLLVGITVAAGAILWLWAPNLPARPVSVQYEAIGDQSEPAWGDPTDCSNTTIYAVCNTLPAFFIVFTSHEPASIPLTDLSLELECNGTSLLNGTFSALEVVPGSGNNPGTGSPALGHCSTWSPSPVGTTATYFNRLLYFQQIQPGATVLENGDEFVVYIHPTTTFCDRSGHCPDDDYHGAPPWCFVTAGACFLELTYTANPPALIAQIPLANLEGTNAES